jgi:hypothetical protein
MNQKWWQASWCWLVFASHSGIAGWTWKICYFQGFKRGNCALFFFTNVFTLNSGPIGQTLGMAGLPAERDRYWLLIGGEKQWLTCSVCFNDSDIITGQLEMTAGIDCRFWMRCFVNERGACTIVSLRKCVKKVTLQYNHRSQFIVPSIPLLYQIRPCSFLSLRIFHAVSLLH